MSRIYGPQKPVAKVKVTHTRPPTINASYRESLMHRPPKQSLLRRLLSKIAQ